MKGLSLTARHFKTFEFTLKNLVDKPWSFLCPAFILDRCWLKLEKVSLNQFPSVRLIEKSLKYGLLTPPIINAANEVLVDLFLKGKIGFLDIVKTINMILKGKDFKKYAKRKPSSIKDIKIADNWARLKTINMCVR